MQPTIMARLGPKFVTMRAATGAIATIAAAEGSSTRPDCRIVRPKP